MGYLMHDVMSGAPTVVATLMCSWWQQMLALLVFVDYTLNSCWYGQFILIICVLHNLLSCIAGVGTSFSNLLETFLLLLLY